MLKVHILDRCPHCDGQAYLPNGEGQDYKGRTYTRYAPCPHCEGSGNKPRWVKLPDFIKMLKAAQCIHEHTSHRGGMHFSQAMSVMTSKKSAMIAVRTLTAKPWVTSSRMTTNPIHSPKSAFLWWEALFLFL